MTYRVSLIVVIVFVALCPLVAMAQSFRPQAGLEAHFIVPDGTPIVTANSSAGDGGDLIIFTGRSVDLINLGNCADGFADGHLQSATVVDPGDHRGVRLTNEILWTFLPQLFIGQPPPFAAGTRLSNITAVTSCVGPGGHIYQKYQAVVE